MAEINRRSAIKAIAAMLAMTGIPAPADATVSPLNRGLVAHWTFGKWTHNCIVFDGTSDYVYIDGKRQE